ncbi:unnamed protein product [Prorocentrum cordatum]|uniref:Uncharacterized protein n=1 Tax=Prorocentrum cordatum TaxID=2364126 RepID=A0ABN9QGU2_9DINO|nr:unnamed protein product [Polarella glacialis]
MSGRGTPTGSQRGSRGRRSADGENDDEYEQPDLPATAKGKTKGQDPLNRPRGNLPPPPEFSGELDDPTVFKCYKALVDNWVFIAENIIGPEEIGPRLFGALKDKAFEYVEDDAPSTFAVPNGVELLLQKLALFDQLPSVKIGSAMDDFFIWIISKQAVLQAKAVELDIPDPIIIRQFMKSSQLDAKTQATLLMAAGSTFKWKPLKEQAATLFPLPLVPRNKYQGDRKWRPQLNSVNMANNDGQHDEVWHDEEQRCEDDDQP